MIKNFFNAGNMTSINNQIYWFELMETTNMRESRNRLMSKGREGEKILEKGELKP